MATTIPQLDSQLQSLQSEVGRIRQSNSWLSSELSQLDQALEASRSHVRSLECRMEDSERHFSQERTRMMSAWDEGMRAHQDHLDQIEHAFQDATDEIKDQLEQERNERIAAQNRFQKAIEEQRRDFEEYQKEVRQRFEDERCYYNKRFDQLHQELRDSEKRQFEEIDKIRKKFEQYVREKDEAASREVEQAQGLLGAVENELARYKHLARHVDAHEQIFRIEARKELASAEMFIVRHDTNPAARRSASNRVLLHVRAARSDMNALRRFTEYRLEILKTAKHECCEKCNILRNRLDEFQTLFFPEIQDYKQTLNTLENEICNAYTRWKTFERVYHSHLSILKEIEQQIQALPELIDSVQKDDTRRKQTAREIVTAFEKHTGSLLMGNKEPVLMDMNDCRTDRHVICPLGIYNNIRFVLHINGKYSITAIHDIKAKFEEYLVHHPLTSGNTNSIEDYYAPRKKLNAIQMQIRKLHAGLDEISKQPQTGV